MAFQVVFQISHKEKVTKFKYFFNKIFDTVAASNFSYLDMLFTNCEFY